MKAWRSIVLAVSLLGGIGYWWGTRPNNTRRVLPAAALEIRSAEPSKPPVAAPTAAAQVPTQPALDPARVPPKPRTEASHTASRRDFANPLVVSYASSTPSPRRASTAGPEVAADFDRIALMLRDYRSLTGENPVGTNAEIMRAIMGGNPQGAQLGPPAGQQLNASGELIDRWGTPYFFHQLSKDLMEIHSAGPDRRLGNDDDLVGD